MRFIISGGGGCLIRVRAGADMNGICLIAKLTRPRYN